MNNQPTPETDENASPHIGFYSCATVPAEFARKLERERDEALAGRQSYKQLAVKHAQERDDAREKYATEATEHMLAINKICNERDEARAVAGAMADIAFKHLTSLLASTPHSKNAAHDAETQEVIAAIKRWKELKQ